MLINLFKKTKKEYVALDIGSQNTKVASISGGSINKFIIEPTPEKLFDAGMILDEKGLSKFLMVCLGNLDITTDIEVITGVSGKGVITKKIEIPYMEEDLIAEHLPFEAEQYLPYEIDEMDLDYEILKDMSSSSKTNDVPILLVAVLKSIVSQYNELFEKSFLNCDILDTNVFALFNVFEKNYDLDEKENYFLIDIGLSTTNVVAIIKNQVVFTRSLPIGGDFYTQEIEKRLNLNYAEAEELKKSVSQEAEHPEHISSAIKEINPLFSDEIFSGYEFYLSFFPNNKISQIYITGGGSQCLGLLETLNNKFQNSVYRLNPFQNIELGPDVLLDEKVLSSFGAIVAGLSLRVV